MRVLQNTAVSPPNTEYLVAFSVTGRIGQATRRTVLVLAGTPGHARKICRQRYPQGLHLQVFARAPQSVALADADDPHDIVLGDD